MHFCTNKSTDIYQYIVFVNAEPSLYLHKWTLLDTRPCQTWIILRQKYGCFLQQLSSSPPPTPPPHPPWISWFWFRMTVSTNVRHLFFWVTSLLIWSGQMLYVKKISEVWRWRTNSCISKDKNVYQKCIISSNAYHCTCCCCCCCLLTGQTLISHHRRGMQDQGVLFMLTFLLDIFISLLPKTTTYNKTIWFSPIP